MTYDLVCQNKKCKKHFKRDRKHYKYCSQSCAQSATNVARNRAGKNPLRNKFTPFTYLFNAMKCRARNGQAKVFVTKEDLKRQWEKQRGICPYTGWNLILPFSGLGFRNPANPLVKVKTNPKNASVDRKDSSKPYTPSNIEFVAVMANYCKRDFTRDQVVEFCRAVSENAVSENS